MGEKGASFHFGGGWAAVAQLTALLLLQGYCLLPIIGHGPARVSHGAACRGDHRLCGCPLEKIANRSCCCFQSSALRKGTGQHPQTEPATAADGRRPLRYVVPACGEEAEFVSASFGSGKFLLFAAASERPDFHWVSYLPPSARSFQSQSKEPPDPPPRPLPSLADTSI